MTNERVVKNYPKRASIDDDELFKTVMKRSEEVLSRERTQSGLSAKLAQESGLNQSVSLELIRAFKNGHSLKISRYAIISKYFHFNLCHFFNIGETNWEDMEYVEIDETENAFKRMARVIEYAGYSNNILARADIISNGEIHSVFSIRFAKTIRSAMMNGYDPKTAPSININHIIKLSVLSRLPIHAFFMIDDDEFESILEEKCLTGIEFFNQYSSVDHYTKTRREKRRKYIIENNAVTVENDGKVHNYPIMDKQIRGAIIEHFQMLKDSLNYNYVNIAKGAGVSLHIARSIAQGMNSRLSNYMKICDFFHVRLADFINPDIDELPVYRKKNLDIDLYVRFQNAYKKARLLNPDLAASDTLAKNLKSIWIVFNMPMKGDTIEYPKDVKDAVKYKMFLNTLIDFANIMNTSVFDLLSDESAEPEDIEVPKLKTSHRSKGKIPIYVSRNMTIGRLPTELQELIYNYASLNSDRRDAVRGIAEFLAKKQEAENSGNMKSLNALNEELDKLSKT